MKDFRLAGGRPVCGRGGDVVRGPVSGPVPFTESRQSICFSAWTNGKSRRCSLGRSNGRGCNGKAAYPPTDRCFWWEAGRISRGEGFRLHCQWREGRTASAAGMGGLWRTTGSVPDPHRLDHSGDSIPRCAAPVSIACVERGGYGALPSLVTDRETVQFTRQPPARVTKGSRRRFWPLSPVSAGRVYWEIACLSPVVLIEES